MSILSEFEDRIAGAVEGLFAGAFRSPVQPAEIAKTLAKAMDDGRSVGVGKVYAPISYTVALSHEDFEQTADFRATLAGELATFLIGHGQERDYHLTARPSVRFTAHDDLRLGRFRVSASMTTKPAEESASPPASASAAEAATAPEPDADDALHPHVDTLATVTVSGIHHDVALKGNRAEVGRLADCDISLQDANVSRQHAAFERTDHEWFIVDLDSTNGTFLNESRISRAALNDGDTLQIGATQLVFHEARR